MFAPPAVGVGGPIRTAPDTTLLLLPLHYLVTTADKLLGLLLLLLGHLLLRLSIYHRTT